MSIFKCKMCGGDLDITAGMTVCECEYCGTRQTVPAADNEKKMTLFSRANRLLRGCEFDKAAGVFESIVVDFPEEAEAYWGLVLCKYGIEYVDDPATGRKVPTCHRSSFDSVMDDANFEQTCENADSTARKVYRDEAKTIEELRKGIIEVSGKEEPYDIFICYKETADNGARTLDSVLAQDVYDALTEKGYRVFFSRVTLEDKLGQEYEPYIFAALNSAKVMLAFGTDYDYYNAVWVKNEWSRFLQLIAKGEKKTLIPCYKGIDAYDLPKEFAKLQAQDMGKVGAMQDLLRGIEKILPRETTGAKETVIVTGVQNNLAPLLKRAFMSLEDGDWAKADELCEQVLNQDPENAEAYLGKLMAELQVSKKEELKNCEIPFDGNVNYQKAVRFGDAELPAIIKFINDRNENTRLTNVYDGAVSAMEKAKTEANYKAAAATFDSISDFKDAAILAEQCRSKAAARHVVEEKDAQKRKRTLGIVAIAVLIMIVAIGVLFKVIIPGSHYSEAKALSDRGDYESAYSAFESLKGFKDSEDMVRTIGCKLITNYISEGNMEKAEEYINKLSEREELPEDVCVAIYDGAMIEVENKDYKSAEKALEKVKDYSDSNVQLVAVQEKIKKQMREKLDANIPVYTVRYVEKYADDLKNTRFYLDTWVAKTWPGRLFCTDQERLEYNIKASESGFSGVYVDVDFDAHYEAIMASDHIIILCDGIKEIAEVNSGNGGYLLTPVAHGVSYIRE